jgi:hypothetical protein
MPIVWPLLGTGVPESLKAAVDLLGATGGGYIGTFLADLINRLRQPGDTPKSEAELQQVLERELLRALEANDQTSAGLRAEAAAVLETLHGVETALEAASAEVRQALAEAFADLGGSFGEFRWVLDEARHTLTGIQAEQARQAAEQRLQTNLARETLAKTNLMLRRVVTVATAQTPPPAREGLEEEHGAGIFVSGPSPYKGLETFQSDDAEWFFGRERLVAELCARAPEAPFLAVVGPSGSGKSSLLRAGLLPAVWSGTLPGASEWTTIVLTPGAHPVEELGIHVALMRGVEPGAMVKDLRSEPGSISLAVRQALSQKPTGERLLLVVDQFEEVFTLCQEDGDRRRFIRALVDLADGPDSRATVVLGIRADFYARCADYPELVSLLQDHQVVVGAMTAPELRQVIEGPAGRAGLVLEPGLTQTILGDLGNEPGALPLLSHALFATWQHRRERTLTLAGYAGTGGVPKAIAQSAEAVYEDLDPDQRSIAKGVFLRLTALGEGTADTRRRARRAELVGDQDASAVELVLARLTEARLITLGMDSVEIAHEALIREWPRLHMWLTEDREALRVHRRLTEAAIEWDQAGRDEGLLYRGARLAYWKERLRRT